MATIVDSAVLGKKVVYVKGAPEILLNLCKGQDYQLSEKAAEIAKEFFKNRCENKPDNYANARDVRNYLEKAVSNQASRIVSLKDVNKDTLAVLEKEDVENISLG